MCTAITYLSRDFYFGRTLDYEYSYAEEVTLTPRNFPLPFRAEETVKTHYAIIGMAYVVEQYPLYYDAVNEKGLAMAGLNFVGNAHYENPAAGKRNIAQFELISWILCQCSSVLEAKTLLKNTTVTAEEFSSELPAAQLHWLIADSEESITLEVTREGMNIYSNPVGVLTNNPPFPQQMLQLSNYMHLSAKPPKNLFSPKTDLRAYSRGMGAIGLPGDLSSQSRFVRAAFTKLNSVQFDDEAESVNQFFHILGTVEQVKGCCELEDESMEYTIYTSCCNATKGIYYYTTYQNRRICAVNLHRENLDFNTLVRYPLLNREQILIQNDTPL